MSLCQGYVWINQLLVRHDWHSLDLLLDIWRSRSCVSFFSLANHFFLWTRCEDFLRMTLFLKILFRIVNQGFSRIGYDCRHRFVCRFSHMHIYAAFEYNIRSWVWQLTPIRRDVNVLNLTVLINVRRKVFEDLKKPGRSVPVEVIGIKSEGSSLRMK